MLRTLLTTAAAVLALATPAYAAPPAAQTAQATKIADTAWPTSPCRGHLDVHYDHAPFEAIRDQGLAWVGVAGLGGDPARTHGCTILLDPDYFATVNTDILCRNIVHEAGHLAGQSHAPHGVMAATPEHYSPCDGMLPLRTRITSDLMRRHANANAVVCGPRHGRVLACTVELPSFAASRIIRYRVRIQGARYWIAHV